MVTSRNNKKHEKKVPQNSKRKEKVVATKLQEKKRKSDDSNDVTMGENNQDLEKKEGDNDKEFQKKEDATMEDTTVDDKFTIETDYVAISPEKKTAWGMLLPNVVRNAVEFSTMFATESELESEKLHDLQNANHYNIQKAMNTTEMISIDIWTSYMRPILKQENHTSGSVEFSDDNRRKMHRLMAGLAKSNPINLFASIYKNGKLRDTVATRAWRASVDILGSQYKKTTKQTDPTLITPPPKKTLQWQENVKDTNNKKPKSVQHPINVKNLNYIHRFDITTHGSTMPSDKETKNTVRDWLSSWYSQVKTHVDEKIYILPWAIAHNNIKPISDIRHIKEKNWLDLLAFFPRLRNPSTKDDRSFSQVRLGCNNEFKEAMQENLYWFYQNQKGGLWPKPLDCAERPREIGKLVYSGLFSDPNSTQNIINDALAENNHSFKVGVKLRKVVKSTLPGCQVNYDTTMDWINLPWMMLHLEVDQSHFTKAKRALCDLFNNEATPQPAGMCY